MIDLQAYLCDKVKSIITQWDEDDIYAISFFVYSNFENKYQQFNDVSEFAISYNTERDCGNVSAYSEERWNYAFWRQNTTSIINPSEEDDEGVKTLFQWYNQGKQLGVDFATDI